MAEQKKTAKTEAILTPQEMEMGRLRGIPREKRTPEQVSRLAALVAADRRERFLRLNVKRVKNARRALRNVIRLANVQSYDYTQEEAKRIVDTFGEDMSDLKRAFQGAPSEKGLYDL
jgi:hypothetical protein